MYARTASRVLTSAMALAVVGVLVTQTAASASGGTTPVCTYTPTKGATWTRISGSGCLGLQARIDRYVGGSEGAEIHLGPQSTTLSYVSSSTGLNAGNAYRVRATAYSGWSAWQWF